ncbi:MAG: ribonuclease PH [Planctomycetes bacterium RBG_16_59_8]|nr:MAG: ribonuclease PH [Planctomycetes bacterium RBG_16_59_8]
MRHDGRAHDQLREVKITTGFIKSANGSALIEVGRTRVICTAMVEHSVPDFLADTGKGWVTAEYGMLPASTPQRKQRDRGGRMDGRTTEIQRLVGRALRAAVDRELLGEKTIWLDCDVIEADGGTRTAAITGACVAVAEALRFLKESGVTFPRWPLKNLIAAVSVGMVKDAPCLDLDYVEDSNADVDMNVVMTDRGEIVEVQGTAERKPFSQEQLLKLLDLARKGIARLNEIQRAAAGLS